MRILHVITGLGNGGAEAALMRLVRADKGNTHIVFSLTDLGRYGAELQAMGIHVECAMMRRGRVSLSGLRRLYSFVRSTRCDLVQTWMYHSDLLGGLAARVAGKPVVWGVRHSMLDSRTSLSTRFVAFICGVLSKLLPKRIVFCSHDSARGHEKYRYSADKSVVIPNGFDWGLLAPNAERRKFIRSAWQVDDDVLVMGMVARWHPHKDHKTLLTALQLFGEAYKKPWLCMLVGPGMTRSNESLKGLISKDILDNVRLLGETSSVVDVMNAIDLHLLSSANEAFPNVIVEALACGTPVIATAVGDAPRIVGQCGWLVTPCNPVEMAEAIADAVAMDRAELRAIGRRGLERVRECYGVEEMVERYKEVWQISAYET